jgi:hypothetical protein
MCSCAKSHDTPSKQEEYGIDEFLEVLDFTADFTNPLLDGVDLEDILPIAASLTKLPAAIDNIEHIKLEAKDFSGAEMDQVDAFLQERLKLTGEQYERMRPVIIRAAMANTSLFIEALKIGRERAAANGG